MRELASEKTVLRKRLARLLGQAGGGRAGEVSTVILPQLQAVGSLALIGGAVRDVAREGVGRFRSDLDFVLYDGDLPAFRRLMARLSATENRFGGFSIGFDRWRVDIWTLESTWARTAGLRDVQRIDDVLGCTFFDWDAIIYDLRTRDIISLPGYFAAVGAGVMDINLEENPNPTGSLVRALRRGALWRVRFGQRLTRFVREQLASARWEDLVRLDEAAFAFPVLRHQDAAGLASGLMREISWNGSCVTEPFGPPRQQLPLPLGRGGEQDRDGASRAAGPARRRQSREAFIIMPGSAHEVPPPVVGLGDVP